MEQRPPRLPRGRAQLIRVLSAAGDVIHVDDVVTALQLDRIAAAQRLSRWTEQGWLRRALFAPAYVGGRTAAEHWDLTEQIFKDILVMTTQAVRQKRQERHGALFSLKHIDEQKLFGTKTVWRHQTRVPVSDVHRTIIDMLDDPAVGGGIQHVADCLAAYLRRGDCDDEKLIEYAVRLANGAVFKRLGFLAERLPEGAELARHCEHHLSGGHAKLDPAQEGPRVATKWRLLVPQRWAREGTT
jgi:predicted transcriptional regulator of viral defense system